jgi:hypothetical protein
MFVTVPSDVSAAVFMVVLNARSVNVIVDV